MDAGATKPILVVVTYCGKLPASLRQAMVQLGLESDLQVTADLEIALGSDAFVILALDCPIATLASAMAEGTPPSIALAAWAKKTEALLAFCRPHRERIALVNVECSDSDPAALIKGLSAHLRMHDVIKEGRPPSGIPASYGAHPDLSGGRTEVETLPARNPMLRLLAAASLAGDSKAQSLASELEAMTLTNAPSTTMSLADQVFWEFFLRRVDEGAEIKSMSHFTKSTAPSAERLELCQLLWDHVGLLQEALERRLRDVADSTPENQGVDAKLQQLAHERAVLQAENLRLQNELCAQKVAAADARRRIREVRNEQMTRERFLTAMLFQQDTAAHGWPTDFPSNP